MKLGLLVWLLSTGLAAQAPDPVLVRFDCRPAVEHVQTATGSEISRTEQPNVFRFSVEENPYPGDLLATNPRRFRLTGHGYAGTVRLNLADVRELEARGEALTVPDWHATSTAAQMGYLMGRFAPVAALGGIGLLTLGVHFGRRRVLLGRLQARQRQLGALVQSSSDPLVGTKIGPYRLIDRLGAGGMARVYRAVPDDSLDVQRVCALKIVRPEKDTPEFRQRFLREIQVSMTLDHPNVIRVVDFGSLEDFDFLATELIEGVTLRDKIPEGGLPLKRALDYFSQLLEALEYAHARGIVHRDLKPDNMMVDNHGRLKLMDFGLARDQRVPALTVAGGVMGTPDYMAPEQLGDDPRPNPLSDQYSAGLILYRLLCGRLPFDDQDTVALIYATVHQQPPSPRRFRPELTPELEEMVLRMLAKEPALRFPDLKALRAELGAHLPAT